MYVKVTGRMMPEIEYFALTPYSPFWTLNMQETLWDIPQHKNERERLIEDR
jgi:hypothetical protein